MDEQLKGTKTGGRLNAWKLTPEWKALILGNSHEFTDPNKIDFNSVAEKEKIPVSRFGAADGGDDDANNDGDDDENDEESKRKVLHTFTLGTYQVQNNFFLKIIIELSFYIKRSTRKMANHFNNK